MSAGIKALNYGSEICRDFIASVKRNPLKKGVLRCVTVSNGDTVKTMGRIDDFKFVQKQTPDGVQKIISTVDGRTEKIKFVQYPDGSWTQTTYNGMRPLRTDGEFVILKKGGIKVKIGYGVDGEFNPKKMKEFFVSSLKTLGEPKYNVNLKEIFSDVQKTPSRIRAKVDRVIDKVSNFFARYNKTNRTLRRLARSFET